MHSKEGVTQGDPLAMIAYGIGVLLLIRELWGSHPRVTQMWYANDEGGGRKFPTRLGPPSRPAGKGPAKRLLPVADHNYFGRCPTECRLGGGVLQRDGAQDGDGEQVS